MPQHISDTRPRSSSSTPHTSPHRQAPGKPVGRRQSVNPSPRRNPSFSLRSSLLQEAREDRLSLASQSLDSDSIAGASRSSLLDLPTRADTPNEPRASLASRVELLDSLGQFRALLQALSAQSGNRADFGRTGEILGLLEGSMQASPAALTGFALGLLPGKSAAEIIDLLGGLVLIRSKLPGNEPHEGLGAIEQQARTQLLAQLTASAGPVMQALAELAAKVMDRSITRKALQDSISGLPHQSLLMAVGHQDLNIRVLARMEVDNRHQRTAQETLTAVANARTLAGGQCERQPDLDGCISTLSAVAPSLDAHEKYCAIHGRAFSREITAALATLGPTLKGQLERGEFPLQQSTPGQREALLAVLGRLGVSLQASQLEGYPQASYMRQCMSALQDGRPDEAMNILKAAQQHQAGMPVAQQSPLSLDAWLKLLPREELLQVAQAMNSPLLSNVMGAMKHLGSLVEVGVPLGAEIIQRHRDFSAMRAALGRALNGKAPVKTIAFASAVSFPEVRATLCRAFPLEIHVDASGVHVAARNGPVSAKAQAMFARAFAHRVQGRDLPHAEINGVSLASGFVQSVRRIRCSVHSALTGRMDALDFSGRSDAAIAGEIKARTGATNAQMTTLSRLFDSAGDIDRLMLSQQGVLRLGNGTTVLPILSPGSRRESGVEINRDREGNLRVRLRTELTAITGILTIEGNRLLQMQALAPGADHAEFTHEVVISTGGKCSEPQLQRAHGLQLDRRSAGPARPFEHQRPLVARDLLANADVMRTLADMVDRQSAPAITNAAQQRVARAAPAVIAQKIIDEAQALLIANSAPPGR